MAKHLFFAGHGQGYGKFDPGATGNGYTESDLLRKYLIPAMKKYSKDIDYYVDKDVYATGTLGNFKGYQSVTECHFNSYNASANGCEVLIKSGFQADEMDKKILAALAKYFYNRGIKTTNGLANINTAAAIGMNFRLVEVCFISNANDVKIFLDNLDSIAKDIVEAIEGKSATYVPPKAESKPVSSEQKGVQDIYILNVQEPSTNIAQMKQWAKNRRSNKLFIDLAETFYDVAVEVGVNPAVLYTQSAKETNFMNFGGVLDASFKNPCGLKIPQGGGDTDPNAHKIFETWYQGIKAMAEHLALYAGKEDYPLKETGDPRHFPYLFGTAPNVSDLTGKWATPTSGEGYGESVIRLVNELLDTDYTEEVLDMIDKEISDWAREGVEFCQNEEIMVGDECGFRPKDNVTREELATVVRRIFKKLGK